MKKPRFLEFGLFVIELDWKGCKPSALSNQGHFAVNRTTFPKNIWCTWLPAKTISQSRLLGGEYLHSNRFDVWPKHEKTKVTNLKSSTLSRPVSTDPHSISQRPSGLLNNTWAGAAPWAVTHVNRHYVIILTDGDSTVTYNTPTRPETSVNLKRK